MGRSKNRRKTRKGSITKNALRYESFGRRYYYFNDWCETRRDIWCGFFFYEFKVDNKTDEIINYNWKDAVCGVDENHYWWSNLWEVSDLANADEYSSILLYAIKTTIPTAKTRSQKKKLKLLLKKRQKWIEQIESNIKDKRVLRYGEIRAKGYDKHPELLDPIKDKDILEYLKTRKIVIPEPPKSIRKRNFAEGLQ